MIRALVLMNVERGQVPATAKRLADMDEVVDVYSTAGDFDLVRGLSIVGKCQSFFHRFQPPSIPENVGFLLRGMCTILTELSCTGCALR